MNVFNLFIVFSFLLCSCSDNNQKTLIPMQEIKGRDYNGSRFGVYRARVPPAWIRKDSLPEESLIETTKPIGEFLISNNHEIIRITIHNFQTDNLDQRIPPAAQIARWQRQFEVLIAEESSILPQAFSGYSGLKFKGVGILNKNDSMVLGWSLQLNKEHYRTLSQSSEDKPLFREMRADITIKAVGPKEFMEANEEEIVRFARSFELIQEIPSRS